MFLKICALSIISVCAYLILSGLGASLSFAVKLSSTVLVGGAVVVMTEPIISQIFAIASMGEGVVRYASVAIKAVGLAIISRLCSDMCRDCGETSLASGIELAFRCEMIVLCLPFIKEIFNVALEIMDS